MKEKFLIFGKGQVGTAYKDYLTDKGEEVFVAVADIRKLEEVKKAIAKINPTVVINLAAKTDLDWCEKEENRVETFEVNTLGPDHIANVCAKNNIYFLHISSGCIYHSDTPEKVYKEDDPPCPKAFYSWTKVWAENLISQRVRMEGLSVLVLRPRQLISSALSPRNALLKLFTYDKFIDIQQSATVVEDLLDVSYKMIKKRTTGVINTVNPGLISPYQTAELIKKYLFPEMEFVKISNEELDKIVFAKRVAAVLDISLLKRNGIEMPDIKERAVEIIKELRTKLNTNEGRKVLEEVKIATQKKLSLV